MHLRGLAIVLLSSLFSPACTLRPMRPLVFDSNGSVATHTVESSLSEQHFGVIRASSLVSLYEAAQPAWSFRFVLCAVVILLFLAVVMTWLSSRLQSEMFSMAVCAIYVAFSVTIDISIAMQRDSRSQEGRSGFDFDPACVVVVTEVLKLTVSMFLYLWNRSFTKCDEASEGASISFHDAKWLAFPAFMFTTQNLLVYKAIGANDMAAFGVFRDSVILFTAGLWVFAFGTPLGHLRISGVMVIFFGLIMNRGAVAAGGSTWSWSFVWVLLMAMSNAMASVSNEFALKRSWRLDINLQNSVLYSSCVLCALSVLCFNDPARLTGFKHFFAGFTRQTLFTVTVQAVAGLLVSRLLKYADAVTKTVASCLRGPLVVVISPIFVQSPQDAFTNISALIVAMGCFAYLSAGRLEAAPPSEASPVTQGREYARVKGQVAKPTVTT